MPGWTHKNLNDIDDVVADDPKGERWEVRGGFVPFEAEQTGFTHFFLKPSKRSPFIHRQKQAEEVYLILSGTGSVWLDGEVSEVTPRDAIRVAPEVGRAFEAGEDGLEYLAFGPRYEKDGELVESDWPDESA